MNQRQLKKSKNIFFIYLGIDILFNAVIGFNTFLTMEVLKDIQAGVRNFHQLLIDNLNFWSNVSFLTIVVFTGVGVSLVIWLRSCYQFARVSMKSIGFKHEKWVIAGWLVPVYNFVKPYQIVNEIYKVGSPNYSGPDDWKNESASGFLLIWWIFWVVTHLCLGYISIEIVKNSRSDNFVLEQLVFLYGIQVWFYVISSLISISWFMVAGILTRRLVDCSDRAASHLGANQDAADLFHEENRKITRQAKNAAQRTAFANIINDFKKEKLLDYSCLNEDTNHNFTTKDDFMEKDWSVALKYYKDLGEIESRLAKISRRLSVKFRACILKEKAFDNRREIADAIEHEFFRTCFGENREIVDFAHCLIEAGNKSAARNLSEAVRVLGDQANPVQIIEQVKSEFKIGV
jgi:hypothetical protein